MKVIHRYVLKEVREIVVYYLWLVEPFMRQLQMMAREQEVFSTFMWEPEPEEEYAEEEYEDEEFKEEEFQKEFPEESSQQGGEEEQEEQEEQEEDKVITDGEKTGREEQTARNIDGFWGTDRVRRVLQKQTGSRIRVKISTAI
jgi:hypothetical protein